VTGGQSKHDFVVWNPWEAKAKRMDDFGDDEYHSMCCVEPGFVKEWETLSPDAEWSIRQTITAATDDDDGSRL
jgi:glucose-6-phosphate 1-epimerase